MCSCVYFNFFKYMPWGLDIRHAWDFSSFLWFDDWFRPEFIFCTIMFILVKSNSTSFFFLPSGLRSSGEMQASFTFHGKHFVSDSESLNVCIWKHTIKERIWILPKQKRSGRLSCLSHNAAIGITCGGIKSKSLSSYLGEDFIQRSSISYPRLFIHDTQISFSDSTKDFCNMAKLGASWFGSSHCSPTIFNQGRKLLWGQVIVTSGCNECKRVYQITAYLFVFETRICWSILK